MRPAQGQAASSARDHTQSTVAHARRYATHPDSLKEGRSRELRARVEHVVEIAIDADAVFAASVSERAARDGLPSSMEILE